MNELIGTHNSATGEKPIGWLSKMLNFTAKCQNKTIKEQFNAGARLFDIRVTDKFESLEGPVVKNQAEIYEVNLCGHGLCIYDISLYRVLQDLDNCGKMIRDQHKKYRNVYAIITFEGSLNDSEQQAFVKSMQKIIKAHRYVKLLQIAVKKPKWKLLLDNTSIYKVSYTTDYFKYDKWYKYLLPIPRKWKQWQKYTNTGSRIFSLRDFV